MPRHAILSAPHRKVNNNQRLRQHGEVEAAPIRGGVQSGGAGSNQGQRQVGRQPCSTKAQNHRSDKSVSVTQRATWRLLLDELPRPGVWLHKHPKLLLHCVHVSDPPSDVWLVAGAGTLRLWHAACVRTCVTRRWVRVPNNSRQGLDFKVTVAMLDAARSNATEADPQRRTL